MEKNNEKGKNIVIGILIGIIACLVIALVFVSYNKFIVKDDTNNSDNNKNTVEEKQEDNIVPLTHKIELQEKNGSCTGMNFTYKELFIDDKKIDLGFTSNDNSCLWTFIHDYEKTDDFIVLNVDVGYVEGSRELYIINYDGNILKTTESLGKDVKKYYIENNSVYVEMYGAYQDPCYAKKDDVAGGLYKLEYLGNNKFSEIKKVKDKTIEDLLKLDNLDYDTFCKH